MKRAQSRGDRIFDILNYTFMFFVIIIMVYPMLYVLFASLSNSNALMAHEGLLLYPLDFTAAAYEKVFQNPLIISGYINTIILLIIGVPLNVFMTALGGYFLSRKNVMFKKPIMIFFVLTMYISGGMIPFFLTVKNLGMLNTRASLIVPFLVSTYNMILMRTFMQGIPDSLSESAQIDGAGHMKILIKVILPLCKPIIAVMVLYYGVGTWNSWFWASIFIRNTDLYPLQVILRDILISNDVSAMDPGSALGDLEAIAESIKYATIVVATVPILCIYPFLQKYFVKGVMVGSLKE